MLPVSPQLRAILRTLNPAPRVYASFSVPAVLPTGEFLYQHLGSQITLQEVISARRISILTPGSDSLDLTFQDDNGDWSPLNPTSRHGRYTYPGAVDNKIQLFIGLAGTAGDNMGAETIFPKGVFIGKSFNQRGQEGSNQVTISALDQFCLFNGDVYTQFPPKLYGNQLNEFYNPSYALKNPSGDLRTYVCDAVNWMTDTTQAPLWASDYIAVMVYTSDISGGQAATTHTYTVDYPRGIVTFDSPLPSSGTVVSVDARPLSMAPELALKHLFVDFGFFNEENLAFDQSGIQIPIMENARDRQINDVMTEIMSQTASRGLQWQLYFDEYGALRFTESWFDGPPVATLIDERDILTAAPEYNSSNVVNVVRAQARTISDQPLTIISYDLRSLSNLAQQPTYDIPYQLLTTVNGMDPGSAVTYMSGLTSGYLFANSIPTVTMEVEVLGNPAYQVGDPVNVYVKAQGLNKRFYIQQIEEDPTSDSYAQKLTLNELLDSQDYMFGIGAYTGAPLPNNSNQIQAQTGLIDSVSINGTAVVTGGQPNLDPSMSPVLAQWNGYSDLPISIGLASPQTNAQTYIWRWIYIAEDAYTNYFGVPSLCTGNGSGVGLTTWPISPSNAWNLDLSGDLSGYYSQGTEPYDVRANFDSPRSRRYWWPLFRPSDWLTHDGTTAYSTSQVLTSTISGGLSVASPTIYGRLRVGLSDFYRTTSPNYVGVSLYADGTPSAQQLGLGSTVKYGVDFGDTVSGATLYPGIKRKITPAYLCILVASTAGSQQFKRIPFQIVV